MQRHALVLVAVCVSVYVCMCVTCTSSSTDRDQMGPILCDGLYWELVLTERGLLHNGNRRQRSSLRALDDATDSTYRRGCDGWDRLHFDYTQGGKTLIIHTYSHNITLYDHTGCPRENWYKRLHESGLTFDLLVLSTSVLLRFWTNCGSRLSGNSCHGDGWDLVDDVHRLHNGGGAN